MTTDALESRLDYIEMMLTRLCEYAGIHLSGGQDAMRAFITTREGTFHYWDVEAPKSRAVGIDAREVFELGLFAVSHIIGLISFEDDLKRKEAEGYDVSEWRTEEKKRELSTGQYL